MERTVKNDFTGGGSRSSLLWIFFFSSLSAILRDEEQVLVHPAVATRAPPLLPDVLTPDTPVRVELSPGDSAQLHFRCLGAPADAEISLETFEENADPVLVLVDPNAPAERLSQGLATSFQDWLDDSSHAHRVRAKNVPSAGARVLLANVNQMAAEVLDAEVRIRCSYLLAYDFLFWNHLQSDKLCPAGRSTTRSGAASRTSFSRASAGEGGVASTAAAGWKTDADYGVVLSAAEGSPAVGSPPTSSFCSNQGTCEEDGICRCDAAHTGLACEHEKHDLLLAKGVYPIDNLWSGQYRYFRIRLPERYRGGYLDVHVKSTYPIAVLYSTEKFPTKAEFQDSNFAEWLMRKNVQHLRFAIPPSFDASEETNNGPFTHDIKDFDHHDTAPDGDERPSVDSSVMMQCPSELDFVDEKTGGREMCPDPFGKVKYCEDECMKCVQCNAEVPSSAAGLGGQEPALPGSTRSSAPDLGSESSAEDEALDQHAPYDRTAGDTALRGRQRRAVLRDLLIRRRSGRGLRGEGGGQRQDEFNAPFSSSAAPTCGSPANNKACAMCIECVPVLQKCGKNLSCRDDTISRSCSQNCATCSTECAVANERECEQCGCCKKCLPWGMVCAGTPLESATVAVPEEYAYLAVYNHRLYYSDLGPSARLEIGIEVVEDVDWLRMFNDKSTASSRSRTVVSSVMKEDLLSGDQQGANNGRTDGAEWLSRLYNPFESISQLEHVHQQYAGDFVYDITIGTDGGGGGENMARTTEQGGNSVENDEAASSLSSQESRSSSASSAVIPAVETQAGASWYQTTNSRTGGTDVNVYRDRVTLIRLHNRDERSGVKVSFLDSDPGKELILLFSNQAAPKTLFDFTFAAGADSAFPESAFGGSDAASYNPDEASFFTPPDSAEDFAQKPLLQKQPFVLPAGGRKQVWCAIFSRRNGAIRMFFEGTEYVDPGKESTVASVISLLLSITFCVGFFHLLRQTNSVRSFLGEVRLRESTMIQQGAGGPLHFPESVSGQQLLGGSSSSSNSRSFATTTNTPGEQGGTSTNMFLDLFSEQRGRSSTFLSGILASGAAGSSPGAGADEQPLVAEARQPVRNGKRSEATRRERNIKSSGSSSSASSTMCEDEAATSNFSSHRNDRFEAGQDQGTMNSSEDENFTHEFADPLEGASPSDAGPLFQTRTNANSNVFPRIVSFTTDPIAATRALLLAGPDAGFGSYEYYAAEQQQMEQEMQQQASATQTLIQQMTNLWNRGSTSLLGDAGGIETESGFSGSGQRLRMWSTPAEDFFPDQEREDEEDYASNDTGEKDMKTNDPDELLEGRTGAEDEEVGAEKTRMREAVSSSTSGNNEINLAEQKTGDPVPGINNSSGSSCASSGSEDHVLIATPAVTVQNLSSSSCESLIDEHQSAEDEKQTAIRRAATDEIIGGI
ncbi:unnamed protein product [Amoebophrya sp. A120]|nr:unnamed protein product [Amoebophrya sp. A120]|eukprot:GSA120T00017114001.1